MFSAKHGDFVLYTNMNKLQVNINRSTGYKIHQYIAPDKLRSVFFINKFIYFIFKSCTTRPTYLYCKIIIWVVTLSGLWISPPINWSDHMVHDLVADQLVRPFGIHFYSALTSPPTSWLGCSVLDSSPTN